jgi:hypothetical protein
MPPTRFARMSSNSKERLGTYNCKYSTNIGKIIVNTNKLVNNFFHLNSPLRSIVPTLAHRKVNIANTPKCTNLSAYGNNGTLGKLFPGVNKATVTKISHKTAGNNFLFFNANYAPINSAYSAADKRSEGRSPETFTFIIHPSP